MKEEFIQFGPLIDKTLPLKVDFIGESFCDKSFFYSRKCSGIMSLEYIVSGTGKLCINSKEYSPKEDDVFFLSKGSEHKYYCTNDDAWHKIFVSFSGELANKLVKSYIPNDTYLFENTNLKNIFVNIFKTAQNENYDYRERNDKIIVEIMRILVSLKSSNSPKHLELADIIKRTLDKNLQKPYTIDRLSLDLNYTKNYLINVFRDKFGETPYQYLCRKRIELAKEYLESTQFSVGEIADLLCYADSQYFSTCFKRATGCTPTQYKKNAE